LYAHGPWFLKEYGSLGVWQCQGMEKSHWRARGNWQKHTNHDGGRQALGELTKSSLYQLVRFDYRLLQHRLADRAACEARAEIEKERLNRKQAAKLVWQRWYDAASPEAKDAVPANAKAARDKLQLIREALDEEKERIKLDVMKCHGIVDEHVGVPDC